MGLWTKNDSAGEGHLAVIHSHLKMEILVPMYQITHAWRPLLRHKLLFLFAEHVWFSRNEWGRRTRCCGWEQCAAPCLSHCVGYGWLWEDHICPEADITSLWTKEPAICNQSGSSMPWGPIPSKYRLIIRIWFTFAILPQNNVVDWTGFQMVPSRILDFPRN
jgi:hypothetical protein